MQSFSLFQHSPARFKDFEEKSEKEGIETDTFFFRICSVSCHFEAIHRREIRILYAKRNGFLTSFEMTDGANE